MVDHCHIICGLKKIAPFVYAPRFLNYHTDAVTPHNLTWISLLSRHRQDNFYLLHIVQITPVQDLCNWTSISLFRLRYLVLQFFFRSWHRCTDNLKGKVLMNKISHSGCTILYQVSNKSTLQNSEVLAPQYWQSERNARNIFKKSGDSMPQKDHKTTLFNDKTLDDDFVLIQIYISEARIVGPERGLFRCISCISCISCTDHRPWLTDRNWRLTLPHV